MENQLSPPKRADALDALRGFAMLMMVLSGVVPFSRGVLPAWMYHAQEAPPTFKFNPNLPGLTWVDLVFPLFLFSMGAAIPLALSRRLAKGWDTKRIILSILKRGFLLGTFAIFLQHVRPTVINPSASIEKWWIALLGFVLLFFMFVRWPQSWPKWISRTLTLVGWGAGIVVLTQLRYPDGSGFSLARSDIILLVLSNVAVFGSLIWLFTESNLWVRVGFLGLLFALRLSSVEKGWIADIFAASPITSLLKVESVNIFLASIPPVISGWIRALLKFSDDLLGLLNFEFLKYLFIVIPGTIAGDFIREWLQTDFRNEEEQKTWKMSRFGLIFVLTIALNFMLLVGLQGRWVWQTTLMSAILCLLGWFLFRRPTNPTEKLLNSFYNWGLYWLALGLAFEPYQGGIKKDPSTMSYYFVTTGMSLFILIAFTLIIETFKNKKWVRILIDNGQNPMIAYMAFANLIWPILVLNNWEKPIVNMTSTPEKGFFRAIAYTSIIAIIVSVFSRLKLFLRT